MFFHEYAKCDWLNRLFLFADRKLLPTLGPGKVKIQILFLFLDLAKMALFSAYNHSHGYVFTCSFSISGIQPSCASLISRL